MFPKPVRSSERWCREQRAVFTGFIDVEASEQPELVSANASDSRKSTAVPTMGMALLWRSH